MKILYVSTISITMGFFPAHFKMLLEQGHTIELACNTDFSMPKSCEEFNFKVYHIPFSRSPLAKANFVAMKLLKILIKDGNYDIVHVHTPNASVFTRLACRKFRKKGLKVFYTAHGFHFYKGAPLKNWLLYYPMEWLCAFFTDTLITINSEDFERAKKRMHAKNVVYVPGVGIDLEKFGTVDVDKAEKRKELGVPEDAVLLLSVGELNHNKNHETIIKAISDKNVYYFIAGIGYRQVMHEKLVNSLGMSERVKFLGFRSDVDQLCKAADIFVFPSCREGLSVSLMEAMATGLPCVVSRIRGNTDLIDENGGFFCGCVDEKAFSQAIDVLCDNKELCLKMGQYNVLKVKSFSTQQVLDKLKLVYSQA